MKIHTNEFRASTWTSTDSAVLLFLVILGGTGFVSSFWPRAFAITIMCVLIGFIGAVGVCIGGLVVHVINRKP